MAKWQHYLRKRITRRFSSMLLLSLLLILAGAVFVLLSTIQILQKYELRSNEIRTKQELVAEIGDYSNEIILRARGYYVYLNQFEYKKMFEAKKGLEQSIADFKRLEFSEDEERLIAEIESFFHRLFRQPAAWRDSAGGKRGL